MEKTLKSNLVFDWKVVKVYKDDVLCENGNTSVREIIRHNGGVCILGIVDKFNCSLSFFVVFETISFDPHKPIFLLVFATKPSPSINPRI